MGFLPVVGTVRQTSLSSAQLSGMAQTVASSTAPADDLYRKLTVGAAVFFVTLEIAVLVHAGWPPPGKPWLDAEHYVFGRDFINTWMGGRSVFFGGPAPWFDARFYNETVRQMMGVPYPEVFWSYPPHIVLFAWPFGFPPYLPAYVAWCAIGIALYLFVARRALPRERLMFLAVAPSIAVCVFFGQNGFYTAALLIAGMLSLERRPVLAGILFGLLTIKPQLGLLLPVVLVLERRWVTIASAAITAAALVVATAMLFGWSVWIEFLQKVVPQQAWLTEHGGDLLFALVGSVYFGARLIHLPAGIDWAVQGAACAFAFAGVAWTYWRRRDPALSFAFFVTAIFLFTPYILNYDMVILGFVVALLRGRDDNTKADHWLLIAVWTLPITMMIAAVIKIPLAPIVLIAFGARLLWRLAPDRRVAASPPGEAARAVASWCALDCAADLAERRAENAEQDWTGDKECKQARAQSRRLDAAEQRQSGQRHDGGQRQVIARVSLHQPSGREMIGIAVADMQRQGQSERQRARDHHNVQRGLLPPPQPLQRYKRSRRRADERRHRK